jgi:hypothetical protein
VKQKVVEPPEKKHYNRGHLAYFFVVCIMKRVLSISEICDLIAYMIKLNSIEYSYNLFCEKLENAIKIIFSTDDKTNDHKTETTDEQVLLESAVLALAYKVHYQIGIKNSTANLATSVDLKSETHNS